MPQIAAPYIVLIFYPPQKKRRKLKPSVVPIHNNPLNPATPRGDINDPSQITDFDGFVGLTHIRGGGTGRNEETGATTTLAFQADMGFGQGKFIGVDGRRHEGTFAFV